jgi:hypothetical protein
VQVVAIDPSAAFRKAITDAPPHAAVSVDHFHLVQLANQMLTMVRQRVFRDLKGRRGRTIDPSWANRRLLLRGHNTLSAKGRARLVKTLRQDDPTQRRSASKLGSADAEPRVAGYFTVQRQGPNSGLRPRRPVARGLLRRLQCTLASHRDRGRRWRGWVFDPEMNQLEGTLGKRSS